MESQQQQQQQHNNTLQSKKRTNDAISEIDNTDPVVENEAKKPKETHEPGCYCIQCEREEEEKLFSTTRYFYIDLAWPESLPNVKNIPMLKQHEEMFLSTYFGNKDLVARVTEWFATHKEHVLEKLSPKQKSAISSYCHDDFKRVWEFYSRRKGMAITEPTKDALYSNFDSVFTSMCTPIPEGMLLFEGQGRNPGEDDIYNRLDSICDPLQVGDEVTRYRPTSTSYSPNTALSFIGGKYSSKNPKENQGCLVVYRINDNNTKGLIRQLMDFKDYEAYTWFSEAEVIVEPGITLVVEKIEHVENLMTTSIGRLKSVSREGVSCRIVYVSVKHL